MVKVINLYEKKNKNLILKFLKGILFFLFIELQLRVFSKVIISYFEFVLLFSSLLFFLLNKIGFSPLIIQKKSILLHTFLLYLLIHMVYSIIYHQISSELGFVQILLSVLFQYKVGILGFFLVYLFLYLPPEKEENLFKFMCCLMKIAVVYTIIEQIISIAGFRQIIENYLSHAGVVSHNLKSLKSLGLYRIWGVLGSTQLLGVFHCIFLAYIIGNLDFERKWFLLCLVAIFLSTSKTGYVIAIFLIVLDLVFKKKYKKLFFYFIIFSSIVFIFSEVIKIDYIINFIDSTKNYFLSIISSDKVPEYNDGISIMPRFVFELKEYSALLGKGLTFSYTDLNKLPRALQKFYSFSGDYYFLTFINSFGLIGYSLFVTLFLLIPLYNLYKKKFIAHSSVLIVFFFATVHYEPQIHKLQMFFIGFSLHKLYISKNKEELVF